MILFLILCIFNVKCSALYSAKSNVVELTADNFYHKVINNEKIWIVEFYLPWCSHCERLAPSYKLLAKTFNGILKVGAINAEKYEWYCKRYNIQEYPTIKIFSANKNEPYNYKGAITIDGLIDASLDAIRMKVYIQLKHLLSIDLNMYNSDVIKLTAANFDKLVMESEHMWLVKFYSPDCSFCQKFTLYWKEVANELKGKVKVGIINCNIHEDKCNEHKIKSYPTIKVFDSGPKNKSDTFKYLGEVKDIIIWTHNRLMEKMKVPEIHQILDKKSFKLNCITKYLCLISVLPHILECQSECRYNYLNVLKKIAEKHKTSFWGWMWVEAGAQPDLEETFGIGGFGYPALAVLNTNKMKYSLLKGPFTADGINDFIYDFYSVKSQAPIKISALPKIVKTNPWDGKDSDKNYLNDDELDDKDEL